MHPMRKLLPILGIALLFGLVALTGSAAAAPDTGAETAANDELVNESNDLVTIKAGADEGDAGAFAFASAQPTESTGAGGGVRVANEFGGVNYDGDAGGEAAGTGFGAGSGAFLGIPGQNPFYGVGTGGGVGPIGTGVGCFGFYTADDPTPTCNIN